MVARVVKVLTAIAAVAAIGFAIYHFRLWEKDWSTIDDGWASLIGSAVGSFLAVVGALYVSKSEERRKKKEFEEFVKVCVQGLVGQSSYLEAMAREPHKIAPTPEVQHGIISIQLRNLTDALAVFDREVAQSKEGSYQLRSEIVALDAMIGETRHSLSIQRNAIQELQNWHVGAYQIRYHTMNFLARLGWFIPIPSSVLISERVKSHIETWQSWNIPTKPIQPSVTTNGVNQPLYHTNA